MTDPTGAAAPPPSSPLPEAALGNQSVIIRSIGRSPAAVTNALRAVAPGATEELTRKLLQAPSLLVSGVSEQFSTALAAILRDVGLQIDVCDDDAPFEPGVGDHEVAIYLKDPTRLREVAGEIAAFLGCDVNKAAQLAWSSPALLIGKVSAATVQALRDRFEPLGAELDVSVTAEALYDVYLGTDDRGQRTIVEQTLRTLGVPYSPRGPLIATGLGRAAADRLWAEASRRAPVRLLDHAFQRFDVVLEGAEDTEALRAHLVETTGMPERIVPKLLASMPRVLHAGVPMRDVPALLEGLAAVGAKASARLLTFQSFDLVIDKVADPAKAVTVVSAFVANPDGLMSKLQRPPVPLDGPFTQTRALWMKSELAAVGVTARMVERSA